LFDSDGERSTALIYAIDESVGKVTSLAGLPRDCMRVTMLDADLESLIVFLDEVCELFEHEQSLRLPDSEKGSRVSDNIRKLHMTTTQVSQRLVLTYVGKMSELADQSFFNIEIFD
jgi:hypothetical protein